MKIGITGASGFIGAHVIGLARKKGHTIVGFSRRPEHKIPGCDEMQKFSLDEKMDISGCEAIIHLAGEPVFGIWTKAKRERILKSRTLGTRHVVDAIVASPTPPLVFVSGSATGFYGDTGDIEMDEGSPAGSGFLAEVTQSWEIEALRAQDKPEKKTRVVLLRTSVVLGRGGGAIKVMLPIFRAGLGGRLGSGRQWMAWIHIDDIAALALHAVENQAVSGPVNGSAPQPSSNAEFTTALAHAVHRPAIFRTPAFLMKAILGEFSRELLDSKRILPKHTLASGFTYRHPTLESALAEITAS